MHARAQHLCVGRPSFEKISTGRMIFGTAQVNGRGRSPPSTEDRVSTEHLLDGCDYFAIFDGHSGERVASLSKELLHKRIKDALLLLGENKLEDTEAVAAMLKAVFIEHNKYLASPAVFGTLNDSGSTATVALVTQKHIYMAYLGDSPCFLLNPRNGWILERMGKHEPSLAAETARINAAGGFVEIDEFGTPRVDGMLAVARAFGDFSLNWKGREPPAGADWTKMKVCGHPDVSVWKRPAAGVLAIMSDGLVETESGTLKPLEQVGRDIFHALEGNQYDLTRSTGAVLKKHVSDSTGSSRYGGDDLSLILVDVGTGGVALGGGPNEPGPIIVKNPSRKARRKRVRTGKKDRLIKIFSC